MQNSLKHKDLVHYVDENTSFFDRSIDLNDYLRGITEIKLGNSNVWYVGFTKPFTWLFAELEKENKNPFYASILEYWNGTSWVALPNLFDDTKNFTRSGFIRWEFERLDKIRDSWETTVVNGLELFWVRIQTTQTLHGDLIASSTTGNTTAVINLSDEDASLFTVNQQLVIENQYTQVVSVDMTPGAANIEVSALAAAPSDGAAIYELASFKGLNIVFCDDQDLRVSYPRIDDYLLKGQSSFISYRQEATDDIIQSFRTGGYVKTLTSNSDFLPGSNSFNYKAFRQMSKWDVLDVDEIRQAAKYLTLAKIFFNVSENNEDKAYIRYRDFMSKYARSFANFYLTLDLDDDGETDITENLNENFIDIRIV